MDHTCCFEVTFSEIPNLLIDTMTIRGRTSFEKDVVDEFKITTRLFHHTA